MHNSYVETVIKRIIVDIDNTLWDLAPELWERLHEIYPDLPQRSDPDRWAKFAEEVDRHLVYKILRDIHLMQDSFIPYPESAWFLHSLREKGCYVIIASHRLPETMEPTLTWLRKYDLVYDELYLSFDKSVLFADCCAVVDDSPLILDKAAKFGIVRAGLVNEWNARSGHPLFRTLREILGYLERECGRKTGIRIERGPHEK